MMSNWNERERKILKLKLGGAEKSYDPLRLILNYNRAVRDKGGAEVLKSVWERYHSEWPKELEGEERLARELQDDEAGLYLAELGAAAYGEKLGIEDDCLTQREAIQALYQFLGFIAKKESEEESLPTSTSPASQPQGETGVASPTTQTTSAASLPST